VTYPVEFLYENALIAINVIHAARTATTKILSHIKSAYAVPRKMGFCSSSGLWHGAAYPSTRGWALIAVP
jgi:hypothetical protein